MLTRVNGAGRATFYLLWYMDQTVASRGNLEEGIEGEGGGGGLVTWGRRPRKKD